jgi:glycerol-3-phosphate dehydrogenase
VRPLYEDHAKSASAVTRDYVLLRDGNPPEAPMLSVLGGKITTYRRLAEHALDRLALPGIGPTWTAEAPLPGGALPRGSVEAAISDVGAKDPWLDSVLADRLVRRYGSETAAMLGDARRAEDLGEDFGAGLTAREVDWLRREEWAQTSDDILWRRTKLGLRLNSAEQARLTAHLGASGA